MIPKYTPRTLLLLSSTGSVARRKSKHGSGSVAFAAAGRSCSSQRDSGVRIELTWNATRAMMFVGLPAIMREDPEWAVRPGAAFSGTQRKGTVSIMKDKLMHTNLMQGFGRLCLLTRATT